MTSFLKTTLVGGVLFLLPLAIVLLLLGYALKLVTTVARPIAEQLHLQQWGELGGVGIVTVRCRADPRPHLVRRGPGRPRLSPARA